MIATVPIPPVGDQIHLIVPQAGDHIHLIALQVGVQIRQAVPQTGVLTHLHQIAMNRLSVHTIVVVAQNS